MTHARRTLALVTAALAALTLVAGCGSTKTTTATDSSDQSQQNSSDPSQSQDTTGDSSSGTDSTEGSGLSYVRMTDSPTGLSFNMPTNGNAKPKLYTESDRDYMTYLPQGPVSITFKDNPTAQDYDTLSNCTSNADLDGSTITSGTSGKYSVKMCLYQGEFPTTVAVYDGDSPKALIALSASDSSGNGNPGPLAWDMFNHLDLQ